MPRSWLAPLVSCAALLACAENHGPASDGHACHLGEPSLEIGEGVGTWFRPFSEGEVVHVRDAPQGGFGVPVRGRMQGLYASERADRVRVVLDSFHGDELIGTFENDDATFYCGTDGYTLFWDTTVGFDPARYRSLDDLAELHDEVITLQLTAEDRAGTRASGRVDVVLKLY